MKAKTKVASKTMSGAAKGGVSAIEDVRKQTVDAIRDAQKQATSTIKDARKEARRQSTRARVTAARTRVRGDRATGSKTAVAVAGIAGLAGGYFLDPDAGKRRRHVARDRALALIRRGSEKTQRGADYVTGTVEGKVEAAKHSTDPERPAANDQALAERVKSEIFQPADAPKDSVNVNVERGIVYLRGQVKRPDEIRKLVDQTRKVDGVAGVESLLHTP